MATIAVIDDSSMTRRFVARALSAAGHTVREVDPVDLTTVLDVLKGLHPDLIVLDYNMPAFTGPSLVRACFDFDHGLGVKVVMLTANRDPDLPGLMEKLGVHAVIHKPASPGDLADTVARVLEG